MRVVPLLLLLVIVSATQNSPFNKLNFSKKRSITSIMAEVEMKIKTGSPLDAVLNLLNDFREAVNGEQVSHDEVFNFQENECESENNFRSGEVQDAQNVLRDSSAQLNVCKTSQLRTSNQQEVNQQHTFAYEEHLNSVLNAAETEATYFKKRGRDYEDSLHAIDEALDILEGISNGSRSFAELSRISKTMLQTSFNIKMTASFAPVFYAFTQIGQAVDASQVEQVEHLLVSLRENIQDNYNEFASSNAESVAAFNEQKDRINSILSRLGAQEERLQDKLDKLSSCISTQSAIVNAAQNKFDRNQQLWDQARALCATFHNEYIYATNARRSELSLVSQLEETIEKRFNQVEDERPVLQYVKVKY